jgi:glycosyltransferase involved in cell wall biosynthesis
MDWIKKESPMKAKRAMVACYYPWIYLRSGAERTILEVARRSRHHWTIYTNHYDREGTYPEFSSLDVVELPRISVRRGYLDVMRGALTLLSERIPMHRHDVLVNHSEGLGDLVLFANHSKPVICYCHLPLLVANDDTVRERYVKRNPYKAPLVWLFGAGFQAIDRLAWKHYSHIFTSGGTVREMIARAGLAKRDKIEILHPGVDCEMIKPSQIFGNYFLAFSRLKWWKNVELAINGFKKFIHAGGNKSASFRLMVAGQVDEGSRDYYKELLQLAKGYPQIQFTPNPNAEEVHGLYTSCYAVLNTTVNEPWGIIPLEANAYGKPVIAVNYGGTKESQIHGQTGLLVNPTPEAFGGAMRQLAVDESLVRKMGLNARNNALKYDWRNHVEYFDGFIDQLVA